MHAVSNTWLELVQMHIRQLGDIGQGSRKVWCLIMRRRKISL